MYNLPLWSQEDNLSASHSDSAKKQQDRKAYRKTHKDEYNRRQKEYYQRHREESIAWQKGYRKTHKEKVATSAKARREQHKEQIAQYHRELRQSQAQQLREVRSQHPYALSHRTVEHYRTRYNLTLIEWFMLLEYQSYCCALCGKPLNYRQTGGRSKRIVVDHNHMTGEVRGLIHVYCNVALGNVEAPGFLESALEYIQRNGVYNEFRRSVTDG